MFFLFGLIASEPECKIIAHENCKKQMCGNRHKGSDNRCFKTNPPDIEQVFDRCKTERDKCSIDDTVITLIKKPVSSQK